ncbi:hypothetical protein DFA_08511 [Cavenderia fasciculata]|uniref:Uncharacterized protein n=1 Tax=Cavenderia fasciculata TaxID=261658 RepID=F4Q2P8_CACFS|nr:uncharacterized protein DFA_08511 [Cavenderia fasciculata]EGG17515.1 hypothetical protein DFA_08511 [Cavenderia fasciculata]|eukprot:XP_004355999.1 hypothetical protein DFA_08511 [Cavenderia fasciculata]
MSEIQKHRGAIQAITRTPFQLPHIKECDFDKQKVTRQLTNPVTNQSTPFTEKYFKCVFPIPDNHVHGNSVIEVLAYKSPLNLVQNIQTPGRSWSLSSLFTKKKKNNKNKPFKKFLLVTNINLIEANTGRVHKVFEVPESIINSMVNDEHEDNPQQQQKGATYIPQSGINRPETSDYFDTKQVKEADIVKEKKYK